MAPENTSPSLGSLASPVRTDPATPASNIEHLDTSLLADNCDFTMKQQVARCDCKHALQDHCYLGKVDGEALENPSDFTNT